jgi:hypothetical protein
VDAHDLDPLVLEFRLISLRRDFHWILSEGGNSKRRQMIDSDQINGGTTDAAEIDVRCCSATRYRGEIESSI